MSVKLRKQKAKIYSNWEEIILEDLKNGREISEIIVRASQFAPVDIKKALELFSENMSHLNEEDIKNLKTRRHRKVLLLLWYHQTSVDGEFFRKFPLEEQHTVLEAGAEASVQAAALALSIGEKVLGAEYWLRAGYIFSCLKRPSQAEEVFKKALTIYEDLTQKNPDLYRAYARTLMNLGTLYRESGRFSQAEEAYNGTLEIYTDLAQKSPDEDKGDIGGILNNLGLLYHDASKPFEAEESYKKALTISTDLSQKNPDKYSPDLAMTLNNVGALYHDARRFFEAEESYKKALTIYKDLAQKNPDLYRADLAMALNNVGGFYRDVEKFAQAEKACSEALTIYKNLAQEDPDTYGFDLAKTLNNLGLIYYDTAKFSQAEEAYNGALEIYKDLAQKNPDLYRADLAMALNNLGALYWGADEFLKAEKMYSEALTIYRELAQKSPDLYNSEVAGTLNNMGLLYEETERISQSEEAYNAALEIYKELAQKSPDLYSPYVAMTLNNLGRFCRQSGMLTRAKKMYNEAIKIRKNRALWFELVESFYGLSRLLDNKPEEAVRLLELAILFSGEEKYKYAQKGSREDLYMHFIQNTNDVERVFGILEALRDSDLLSLQWDLDRIKRARKDKELQKMLVEKLLKGEVHPLKISHSQISEDLLFLYIQKMNGNVLYLVVTQEGMEIHKGTHGFIDLASQLLMNLHVQIFAGRHKKDLSKLIVKFDDLSGKWTEKLPLPVQEIIGEKEVIVFSPDSTSSSFPLEGLLIDGEPVCLSKSVVRAASINQLQKISSKIVIDSSLIIGNPWRNVNENSLVYPYPSRIGPINYLEDAVQEAEMLARTLPYSEVLLGSKATAERFLRELPHYSLIHFAGHGSLGRVLFFSGPMTRLPPEFEPEEFSELRKAWRSTNERTIYMMEEWDLVTDIDILEISLKKGAFVFLSACEAGKHDYAGGGHFQGLAQAFLKSGASHVISSLIPLYDESARDFATSFYEDLFSKKSVAVSLQNTRKRMRESHKAQIYWLPYLHYGSPVD